MATSGKGEENVDDVPNMPTENENKTEIPIPLAKDETRRLKKKRRKRVNESAVVYMSRVPPGMDMGALRSRLSRMGTIGRVWLRPEEKSAVKERRQLGGRRRAGFMDGWIEFHRRRDAKNAISLLNGQPMSGAKRGGRWAHDLWCLKLLPRDYSWQTLIEETGGGARERVLRVKAAVAAGRRERVLVEERDALARRIEKRDNGVAREEDNEGEEDAVAGESRSKKMHKTPSKRVVRRFKQREAVADAAYEDDIDERRAREAAKRLEQGEDTTTKEEIDEDLVNLLFSKKKKTSSV